MFDSGNSKNLYDTNPNRRPMSDRNLNVVRNLEKARSLFINAEKISFKNKKSNVPPCFTGIIWTTTAICELFENEKNEVSKVHPNKELFLMTNRLLKSRWKICFQLCVKKMVTIEIQTARMFGAVLVIYVYIA